MRAPAAWLAGATLFAVASGAFGTPSEDAMPSGPASVEALMDGAFANFFRFSYVQRMEVRVEANATRPLERVLDLAHRRVGEESTWWIIYQSPEHLRGTALLALEHADGAREQFVYAPDLRRVRRISSAQRADRIAGTDFSFEDLDIKHAERFRFRYVGPDTVEGIGCQRVLSEPLFDSGYAQIEWCVDPRRSFIVRMRGLDRHGNPIKILTIDPSTAKRSGDHLIPCDMTMVDERTGSRTKVRVSEIRVDPAFPEGTFSSRALEMERTLPFLSVFRGKG